MCNIFTKWFSGPTFWHLLGIIELVFLVVELFTPMLTEAGQTRDLITMWLAFAAAEILEAINGRKSS